MASWPWVVSGAALGIAVPIAVYAHGQLALPVHHVAVPRDDAPPEEVVRAYVAAVDGHDCATAHTLFNPQNDQCRQRGSVRVSGVEGTFPEGPGEVTVSVTLEQWAPWWSQAAIWNGPDVRDFRLARERGRWRILSEDWPG